MSGLELNPTIESRDGREDRLTEVALGSQKQQLDTCQEHLGPPKRKASQRALPLLFGC